VKVIYLIALEVLVVGPIVAFVLWIAWEEIRAARSAGRVHPGRPISHSRSELYQDCLR
jgi:hypothetical protein